MQVHQNKKILQIKENNHKNEEMPSKMGEKSLLDIHLTMD
jgi:hypothetical protein